MRKEEFEEDAEVGAERWHDLPTMLKCIKKPCPISTEWREAIIKSEDAIIFALVNCGGGKAVRDRDFLFGWHHFGSKTRFFVLKQRRVPTSDGRDWDVVPVERDEAVELCVAADSTMCFLKKAREIRRWQYNFVVSVCQLGKESFSVD